MRLARRGEARLKQELGAHKANSVRMRRITRQVADALDIHKGANSLAGAGDGGRLDTACLVGAPFGERSDIAAPVGQARRRWRDFDRALLPVEQNQGAVLRGNLPETDDHRHAAGARQHRDVARGAPGRQRDAGRALPVDLQEARRREIVGD